LGPFIFDAEQYTKAVAEVAVKNPELRFAWEDERSGHRHPVRSLTLWKDADPDIPILKEAKAEYARLQ
jgi:hypothetical protein